MALPGVRTVLSDRFYSLSRTDTPDGPRVVVIGTRGPADATPTVVVQDYDPYTPRSERDVIAAFGYGSQLHRGYLETLAGGAARVTLVALPEDTTDADLEDTADGNVFDTAFEAAEIVQPDIIVPWGRGSAPEDWDEAATPGTLELGFVADNDAGLTTSLVRRVALKCKEITDRSNPCFAVMGVAPIVGAAGAQSVTATDMSTHFQFPDLIDHDDEAFGDAGSYVTVVAAEVVPVGYPSAFGYSNGAAMLAGQLSSIDSQSAITGRGLLNVAGLRYSPTRVHQQTMIDAGVIPVGLDFNRNAVWVDGQTFGRSTSDYARLTTLRIVFDAMQRVRNKAQTFVGQAATLHMKNSLDTAISSALRTMKENGSLTDGTHVVTYVPRENRAIIDLVLTPVFELRNIDITISVNL